MHWMGATSGNQQDIFNTHTATTDWHTYTIEWTPTMVRFMIDGNTIGTSTSHLPSTPMHWVLQTSTNLAGVAPVASDPGNIQIAWVAAYKMN
jgi:beta-glucanase (GH16 family)